MKRILYILILTVAFFHTRAQDSAFKSQLPGYFLSSDLVFDIESIPVIGFEKFFIVNKRVESIQLDLGYQLHYNNVLGGPATSHGDRISIGVYQGPAMRLGYSVYSHRHRHRWSNYCAPSLCAKYLWYTNDTAKTGRHMSPAYRLQSETCPDIVPQFCVGAKRTFRNFCADFYVGLQVPIKLRNMNVNYEINATGNENPNVPYKIDITTVMPAPLVGIKLGYLWKEKTTRG